MTATPNRTYYSRSASGEAVPTMRDVGPFCLAATPVANVAVPAAATGRRTDRGVMLPSITMGWYFSMN